MEKDCVTPDSNPSHCQEPSPGETPSEKLTASQLQLARRQCVQKYLAHSLAKKDPLRAAFGSINADLMTVELPLADLLTRAFSDPSLSIDSMQKMLPTLAAFHNLTRQIERFAQVDVRITESKKRKRLAVEVEKPR